MTKYEINVRAVVTCETQDPDAPISIEGWEIYDVEREDAEDGFFRARVRCDQVVRVEAGGEPEAIEKAQDDATTIEIAGWTIDEARLWVDEGIDVEVVAAAMP